MEHDEPISYKILKHKTSCFLISNEKDDRYEFSGGPGSQKGVIMEEVVKQFGFKAITVEDIVFSYLSDNVSTSLESTGGVQEFLKVEICYLVVVCETTRSFQYLFHSHCISF